jgi:PIN domain
LIYLDSSVALAHLFSEGKSPAAALWSEPQVSSRLLEYELWNRMHARGLTGSYHDAAKALISQVSLIELSATVLARALEPFPLSVGTLDGLHLATMEFLRANAVEVELASYDHRLVAAARALGIAIYPL